jgi:hypothetical protein
MIACYLCIDWCMQQHSCLNTITYYTTVKFPSSGWCAPCCTGVLRTLLFCWRQRLMPLVRMKMGTRHWYSVTTLLIVFFKWSTTFPGHFTSQERGRLYIEQEAGWAWGLVWICVENLALTGCVASCCTDYPGLI